MLERLSSERNTNLRVVEMGLIPSMTLAGIIVKIFALDAMKPNTPKVKLDSRGRFAQAKAPISQRGSTLVSVIGSLAAVAGAIAIALIGGKKR
jgi:hypothetical protein